MWIPINNQALEIKTLNINDSLLYFDVNLKIGGNMKTKGPVFIEQQDCTNYINAQIENEVNKNMLEINNKTECLQFLYNAIDNDDVILKLTAKKQSLKFSTSM